MGLGPGEEREEGENNDIVFLETAKIESSKMRMKSTSSHNKNNMSLYFKASRTQWNRRMRRTMMF